MNPVPSLACRKRGSGHPAIEWLYRALGGDTAGATDGGERSPCACCGSSRWPQVTTSAAARRQMTAGYLRRLAEHYRVHGGERRHCVAPDTYLNPYLTIQRTRAFPYRPIVPVIQMDGFARLNISLARYQAAQYEPAVLIALAKPGLNCAAAPAEEWQALFAAIREHHPHGRIHILGAGWSPDDLRAWAQVPGWNSMDSTAYYTDALRGIAWGASCEGSWHELAVRNALAATAILEQHSAY